LITITIALALTGINLRLVAGDDSAQTGEVWVTHQAADTVSILHPPSALRGGPVETISLPTGSHPHIITFSPDGKFAYIANMGNGNMIVINATNRQILTSLNFGLTLTHQAKPSPDGSVLLVSQIATKTLFKVIADEATPSWTIVGSLSLLSIMKAPVCSIFRDDGLRAYVSLMPSGIAIVDVPSMTLLGTLPTDGFIACGMIKSHDGGTVFIASAGSGGHLYQLDTATDALMDTGHTLGAGSWHSFNISPDERTGFGTSPLVDQLQIINLAAGTSFPLLLNPTQRVQGDQPDAIAVQGNNVYVSLRVSGKLAVLNTQSLSVN
jgi:DNA-binding beta-propeller fold protein YncE